MKPRHLLIAGLAPLVLAACVANPMNGPTTGQIEDARAAVSQAVQTLGGELKSAMKDAGPEAAIAVCQDKAPKIAAAISEQRGVKLRRVTFKNRNPNSVPDAWETKVLKDFEQKLANGASAASLEYAEVVQDGDGRSFRYMKGLVMQEVCMTCHGTRETIPEGVKAKLAERYPADQATGYLPNMLRGAVSLRKPM